MRNNKKYKLRPRFYISILVVIVLLVGMAILVVPKVEDYLAEKSQVTVSIVSGGDVLIHGPVLEAADTGDGYDFAKFFKHIKPYIEDADLAIANLETTLSGEPYSGYPILRGPDKLAEDLKSVGFDAVTTSNNHAYDGGYDGVLRTAKAVKKSGLKFTGTRLKEERPRYAMTKAGELKVAVIGYTYQDGSAERECLNGNTIASDLVERINTFNAKTMRADVEEIAGVADEAREAGADIVVLCYHWGEEYQTHSNEEQQELARMSVKNADIDVIFGCHPHVPQEMDILKKEVEVGGEKIIKKVPVYYSEGNLISNQRREYVFGYSEVESGVLAGVEITYDRRNRAVVSIKTDPLVYWVDHYGGTYSIIPLDENFESNETLAASGHLSLARAALEETNAILGIDKK